MRSCSVCHSQFSAFYPLPSQYLEIGNRVGSPYAIDDFETLNVAEYLCPHCYSSDRDRLYSLWLDRTYRQSGAGKPMRLLDIAPAPSLSKRLRSLPDAVYRSADLVSPLADDKVDITDMRIYADGAFDLIVCSHVLEHVPDDAAAIRELFRILAPGGRAILMAPIALSLDATDEDPEEHRIQERQRRFGQDDHVRMYSKKDFIARLEAGGFRIEALDQQFFGDTTFREHGITPRSVLYIGRKSAAGMDAASASDQESTSAEISPHADTASPDACRVSIVIPAYKARFLDEALRSAVEQDFEDYEIVICDDCPDGAVADVVAPYLAATDGGPVVRYFRNPKSLGEDANVGECARRARGKYIKFLYDDDVLLPGCLGAMADVLDRHPEVALAVARRQVIDADGVEIPRSATLASPFPEDVRVVADDLTSFLADWSINFIGEPSAVMTRRALLLALGETPMSLAGKPVQYFGDVTMYVNLMRSGDMALMRGTHAKFRKSEEQTSHAGDLSPSIGKDFIEHFRRCIRSWPLYRDKKNNLVRTYPLEGAQNVQVIDLGKRLQLVLHGQNPTLTLDDWLAARVPVATQSRLIDARLADAALPSLAVFVLMPEVSDAGNAAMAATLDSLTTAMSRVPCKIFVLGKNVTASIGAPEYGTPHYVEAGDDGSRCAAISSLAATQDFDWFLVVAAGSTFTASGLMCAILHLLDAPGLRALSADELMRDDEGNLSALLRPDFNLDLLLSMPSGMARHWLFRREAFLDAGGFDPACADAAEFDLLLRLIDAGGIEGLGHVHEPLLITPQQQIASKPSEQESILRHLRHRGYEEARVEPTLPGCYRVHYGHRATPGVSIIIPTKNQFRLLLRCIDTLIEKTAYKNYEVLIVDNGSTEEDACTWLDGLEAMGNPQLRVIRYPQPFNYSAMNNLAAQHARGDYLVLLNNDTAILREDWLDAMLNHAQRPEVGAVGAKLLYPDGRVQHAGVVLGLRGPAEHPFIGESPDAPGYMYRLQVDQDYSAVTGACLMVRKSLYEEVGGLDEEAFKVSYNDVDLCLKVRAAGYLVVWTPHAVLLHEGSVSQAREDKAVLEKKAVRFLGEQDAFYDKWLPVAAHDPAYNDNLTLNGPAFQVETHPPLAWNPLTWRPLPVAVAFAADQAGCGHYRIIQPASAMRDFGLATADVCHRYLSPVEMERASPDTLVLQRQMNESQIGQQQRIARFNGCFKVAELDDYLPQIPRKSAHHGSLPKDILKTMRKSLTLVDRFVVSTPALAEMLDGMHPDIRVVENHLPLHWWADVRTERRAGRKPRVGWGGAAGHRGDLELIADVVQALSDEVEWVFFGMCPDKLKPFVHEIVPPVAIGDYPKRLASLNLDLALAPLEDNTFNQCKSNLRLLEYGACGFPVVCSDVRPYQGDLPVTRVKPRFRDWVDAIRMHVNDLDAAAKAGDALRAAVQRDWMLDEQHARFWLSQWMPG